MKYHCGHDGCDICGARTCAGTSLKRFGKDILVCDSCIVKALKFAIQISESFGGTIIDPGKQCGQLSRKS